MEKQNIQCPKENLSELVRRLEPRIFDYLSSEFGNKRFLDINKKLFNNKDNINNQKKEKDKLEDYLESIEILDKIEDLFYYKKLKLYGNNRDEIVDKLRAHVMRCSCCKRRYDNFLIQEAITEKYLAEKFNLGIEEDIEKIEERLDFEKYLNLRDKEYYNINTDELFY
ncbi:MAG: hypothetical protein QXW97_03595 [Candidatus Pacearchaeota archaeon]